MSGAAVTDAALGRARHAAATAWVVALALLIVYGSLYPFDYREPASVDAAFDAMLHDWDSSRGDALGNIALFVPFGFAVVSLLTRRNSMARIFAAGLASVAVAFVVQLAQIYFPSRTPAIVDVAFNAVGAAIGIAAGTAWSATLATHRAAWGRAPVVPVTILALWIMSELWPLVPALDLQSIKNSLKALRDMQVSIMDIVWHASGVLVAGRALFEILGRRRSSQALVACAALIVGGKVFVVSRVLSPGVAIGFVCGMAAWQVLARHARRSEAAIFAVLLTACTLKGLYPYTIAESAQPYNWVPFSGLLSGSMLINAQGLLESVFLYTAMLGLVAMQGSALLGSTIVLALWVAALEAAQMYLPGRSPDVTDPLLVVLVGIALRLMRGTEAAGRNPGPADLPGIRLVSRDH